MEYNNNIELPLFKFPNLFDKSVTKRFFIRCLLNKSILLGKEYF